MFDLHDYLSVLVTIIVAVGLSLLLLVLPMYIGVGRRSESKLSNYECGFEAQFKADRVIDVKFYLIALLFVAFDVEIVLLFPWAASFSYTGLAGLLTMLSFVTTLMLGFVYEWRNKVLEWK